MSIIAEKLERMRQTGVTRRSVLKGGLLGGIALGLPWQLMGCGDDSGGGESSAQNTAHVDLSGLGSPRNGLPLMLHVGSQSFQLQAHDDTSLQVARLESDRLAGIGDEALTHYASNVLLSQDHLQVLYVTEGDPTRDPDHRYLGTALHVPPRAIRNYRSYLKAKAGGARSTVPKALKDPDDGHTYMCWIDCAVSFVFQHPELAVLDPDLAMVVLAHVDPVDPTQRCEQNASHRQEIIDLAMEMAKEGQAGGYLVAEPLTEPDGSPLYWTTDGQGNRRLIRIQNGAPYLVMGFDDDGNPERLRNEADPSDRMAAVSYRPTAAVLHKAKAAVHAALRSAKDDPDLQGLCWDVVEGAPPISHQESPLAAAAGAGDGLEVQVALNHEGGHDGLTIKLDHHTLSAGVNGMRKVHLKVRNKYQRYVGVFLRGLDANGDQDPHSDPYVSNDPIFNRPSWHETVDSVIADEEAYFKGLVPAVTSFMGVPLSPDWVDFEIPFPVTTSKVEVLFASLGNPTNQYRKVTLPGGFLTGIINMGIPSYFLYSNLTEGPAGKALLNKVFTDPAICKAIVVAGLTATAYGILGDADGGLDLDCASWAKAVGPILVSSGCDALRYAVVSAAAESQSERAIPFLGQALWVAGTAALVSDLAQTTAEILASDPVYRDEINLTWSPKLTILPDPLNLRGGFPETATRYEVSLKLEGRQFHRWNGSIVDTSLDHLDLAFPNIPNGGYATYTINIYAGTHTLVGTGEKRLANWDVAGDGGEVDPELADYTLQIEERSVPLLDSTTYWHKDKIGIEGGEHRWLAVEDGQGGMDYPPAPTATRNDLDCSDGGSRMCAALGLTINQRAKVVGYAWQSAGSAAVCGTNSGQETSQTRTIQNLSLTGNGHPGPGGFLRTPDCRYRLPGLAVSYELMGGEDGYHAFVEPIRLNNGENAYMVRRLRLDDSLTFGGGDLALARLAGPPDAVAIHPGGYLISICRLMGKMEIAALDRDPVPITEAPAARLMAGIGRRPGLLGDPVGVAVRNDGVVLVLEASNHRVSAFDVHGSVLKLFPGGAGGTSLTSFPLDNQNATPLDIAVEGAGYVYILYYMNNGYQVGDYRLDIHKPDGNLLARTTGVAAARLAVDHFRNVVTLNYQTQIGPQGTEPTISLWVPSVPD